jgi:hypothetical protein
LHTDKPGVYKAATRLFIPGDRELRLVIATSAPVKAALNGRTIVADDKEAAFMPAFHRAPASRCVTLPIAAGEHRLELEIVKKDRPLEVYVLPVSSKSKKQPGSYYYLTDVLFLPVDNAIASADGGTASESASKSDSEAGETVSVLAGNSAGETDGVSDGE